MFPLEQLLHPEKHAGGVNSNPKHSDVPGYISQLRIWNGTFSDTRLFTIFIQPFPFVFSPIVSVLSALHSK
jgi:hypothetical protein